MADEFGKPLRKVGGIAEAASAKAPFLYFDNVPTFGFSDGIANISLEALRFTADGRDVVADRVTVAHVRMSLGALKSLKDAITRIEQMVKPASPGTKN